MQLSMKVQSRQSKILECDRKVECSPNWVPNLYNQIEADKIANMVFNAGFNKSDNIPCQIEEGLFLGSREAAMNKDELKRLNITHILTVTGSISPAYPDDFKYKVIRVRDTKDTNLAQYFNECFDFIEEAKRTGGGVLVHCIVGKSRSVTVVVAYLMKMRRMSLSEALEHVRSKRPKASPNAGFMAQLQEFEKSLLDAQQ